MSRSPIVPRRIVIADNDPEVIELLATDLRAEGHDVIGTALSGTEALELCRRLRPDVLVVDFRMPGGPDGVAVAEQLHDDALGIKVVIHTNYRRPDLKQRAARAGAAFLTKGNIRALRRTIEATTAPGAD